MKDQTLPSLLKTMGMLLDASQDSLRSGYHLPLLSFPDHFLFMVKGFCNMLEGAGLGKEGKSPTWKESQDLVHIYWATARKGLRN